jgi:hypothetical protein
LGAELNIGNASNVGTLPEKMVFDWLSRYAPQMGIVWQYQGPNPINVARNLTGPAAATDFVITAPVRQYWRINGNYFHLASAGGIARDRLQKVMLSAYGQVLDLWEDRIYADVGGVCRLALQGIELPPPDSQWVGNRPPGT